MKVMSDLHAEPSRKIPKTCSFETRMESLRPFADCINRNLEIGLIQAWDVKGFAAIDPNVKIGLGNPNDPYYLAFARALAELPDLVQQEDQVAVVCDFDKETAGVCYQHYLGMREASDEIRQKITSLCFEDDEAVPALQAADMVAYLARREAANKFRQASFNFKTLYTYLLEGASGRKMQWKALFMDEASSMTLKPPATKAEAQTP